MEVIVKKDFEEMSLAAARVVAKVINGKPNAVLGLAAGKTPVGLYQELIRMHQEEGLDFSQVRTFNLDEYVGLPKHHPQSYYYYMHGEFLQVLSIFRSTIFIFLLARRTTTPRFAVGTKSGSPNVVGSIFRF